MDRHRGSNQAFGVTYKPMAGGSDGSIHLDVDELVDYGDGKWEVSPVVSLTKSRLRASSY